MISTKTPLRITLGGGGTDLPGYYSKYKGFVFAAAIDKFIYVQIKKNGSNNQVEVHHLEREVVDHRDKLKHKIIREAMYLTGIEKNVVIFSKSDVPPGTGLGSSGSMAVGMLNGLHVFQGKVLSPGELAEEACHLEMIRLNRFSGKQDQYVAAFGGLIVMIIDEDGNVGIRKARISSETVSNLNKNLKIYYTRFLRDADNVLSDQNRGILQNERCVLDNMHRIKEIGYRILDAVEKGNISDIGLLMDQHWNFKKGISKKMSSPYLDLVYQAARETGALGGKIVGAGGGGFFLFYTEKRDGKLDKEMKKLGLKKMNYRFESDGTRVMPNSIDSGMEK